jgi:ADP-ribose pyrophosphatase
MKNNNKNHPPARIISRKHLAKSYFSFEEVEVEPRSLKHDGYTVKISRDVLNVGSIAAVLLYCPETDEILLNQQFRMGVFVREDPDPFLYEISAGIMDAGKETPEEAVRREAQEETGSVVLDLMPVCVSYPSPGSVAQKDHIFIGRIANPKAGHYGLEEEGEEIKTHLLPADRVIAMLDEGMIKSSYTIIAVQWFALHRAEIKKKWGGR